jgi:hypothetical protein
MRWRMICKQRYICRKVLVKRRLGDNLINNWRKFKKEKKVMVFIIYDGALPNGWNDNRHNF